MAGGDAQRDEATIAVARELLRAFAQLGAGAVAFSALAYYLGAKYLDAKFFAFGAGWFADLLSVERKVQAGVFVAVLLVLAAVVAVILLAESKLSVRGLSRLGLGVFAIAAVCQVLAAFAVLGPGAGFVAGLLFTSSAGLGLGEIVADLRERNGRWRGHTIWLVYMSVYYALAQAPSLLGQSMAAMSVADDFRSSSRVYTVPEPAVAWRLIAVVGESGLITRQTNTPDPREFKLVKLDTLVRILSTSPSTVAASAASASASGPASASKLTRP